MKKTSVIGSGNVGANSAFFIAENGTASVVLVDIKEGLSAGKALDISEAGPIRHYDTKISGSDDIQAIRDSDIVVIAAGRVRSPGESSEDLYRNNSQLVTQICEAIRTLAPDAVVINVVEPVDRTTVLAQETLGFDRHRVLGVGGLLSAMRLRYLISKALTVSPREVTGLVIGPHDPGMVILSDSVRVSGIPADKLLTKAQYESIFEEVRKADETILYMAQRATAFYAPSAAVAALVLAIARDTKTILPVSVRLEGEYGCSGIALSVPARIGARGVERIVPVAMTADEAAALHKAAAVMKESMEQAVRRTGGTGGVQHA